MNIPGNWSWGNLAGKAQGILGNPQGLMENPMFRMGMGLLSENRKPFGGDPFSAGIIGGMQGAKDTKQQREDRERIEELRKQIAEWLQRQQTGYPPGVPGPGGGIMTPIPQQPPQTIMGLLDK